MKDKGLYFVPLGGSEQFGVNLNVYICDGEYLAVDCGMGFADERFPGIELLLPDPQLLEDNKQNLKGMIITHAHEDHIGAVAHLWKRFKCPLYATRFTAALLREKFKEAGSENPKIIIVEPMQIVAIGKFDVQFIPVAHSVPDACALMIETSYGNVLHSGDWNLDPKPITGKPTDPEHFIAAGKKGILAYVGDSTNAGISGRAGSETEVEAGLEEEFKRHKGKIAVTIFSSNIGRVISIARAAKKASRQVGVVGRSLHRMIGCAHECGYMKGMPEFLDEEQLADLPDDNVVMIVTGSQGEFRAALAKMARGEHRNLTLNRGDTVIFSARAIPGNDRNINQVKNHLSASKVTVVTPDDTKNTIHVSGHPCRDEIAEMLQWLRPQLVVPVHGERRQLDEHAAFARECQIPEVIVPQNGTLIKLAPGTAKVIDHLETGLLAVDQKRIITADHGSIVQRRKLQFTGAVHVSLAVNKKGEILGQPQIQTLGLIDEDNEAERQIEDNLYDEIMDILDDMTAEDLGDDHFIAEELRIGVRRFMVHTLGMKPNTTVHVLRI